MTILSRPLLSSRSQVLPGVIRVACEFPERHARALRAAGVRANADLDGLWIAEESAAESFQLVKRLYSPERFGITEALTRLADQVGGGSYFAICTALGVPAPEGEEPALWLVREVEDTDYDLAQFGLKVGDVVLQEPFLEHMAVYRPANEAARKFVDWLLQ